jgi:hypothetical protein
MHTTCEAGRPHARPTAWRREGVEDPLTRAVADAIRNAAGLFGVPLIEGGEDDRS